MLTSKTKGEVGLANFVHWPFKLFAMRGKPAFHQRPFTRSGGTTLGGRDLVTQTDLGFWRAVFPNIMVKSNDMRHEEAWNAIQVALQGRTGLVIVPAYYTGSRLQQLAKTQSALATHSDGSTFSDGTKYSSEPPLVQMEEDAQIGATVVKLRALREGLSLTGIKYSYFHALYQTGPVRSRDGDVVQVPIFPATRAKIPAGSILTVKEPTCLMHLASDNEMDIVHGVSPITPKTLNFVEAIDYWDKVAAE